MRSSGLLAIAATFSAASAAVYQGFNYGATNTDGTIKDSAAFKAEFIAAKALAGTNGAFTSARLYTMIQGGTTADPAAAFEAAMETKTTLLLGMWASSGQATMDNEITALKTAISTYGTKFTSLVVGMSVGSEDLYRISPTGILNKSNPGAGPDDIVNYIKAVRSAVAGTGLSGVPIGHVDTWTAFVNGSNAEVITNCDWLGVDAYPYFQNTDSNGVENGASLFFEAYDNTVAVAGGKPVWITETGWPVSGSTENLAVPNVANAKTYWDDVGCARSFGQINTFWFTLQDSFPTTPSPSFGIVGSNLKTSPLYDLSCDGIATISPTATTSGEKSNSTASGSGATGTGGTATISTGMTKSTNSANGTAPTSGSPSTTPTAATSGNSAASFHSGSFVGGGLGAVMAIAALL